MAMFAGQQSNVHIIKFVERIWLNDGCLHPWQYLLRVHARQ